MWCGCSVLDSDATQPSLAGLAALGALWRCVLPSGRSRAQLLALDGMDVLLTLLQRGNQYLRCGGSRWASCICKPAVALSG